MYRGREEARRELEPADSFCERSFEVVQNRDNGDRSNKSSTFGLGVSECAQQHYRKFAQLMYYQAESLSLVIRRTYKQQQLPSWYFDDNTLDLWLDTYERLSTSSIQGY